MLKIGLTGGIGSGKTTVSNIFQSFGIPIYNSDIRAKYLMEHDVTLVNSITKEFGEASYQNGNLNRQYLADCVFSNKENLNKLNKLVHPAVAIDFSNWCKQQSAEFVIKEAAILIESGAYKGLDKIIVVSAPIDIRLKRVMDRDGVDEDAVLKRMQNQLSEEDRLKYADFVIENDGNKMLISQVQYVIKKISC